MLQYSPEIGLDVALAAVTQHSTQTTAPRQFFGEKRERLSSPILLGPLGGGGPSSKRSLIIEQPWRCSDRLNVPSLFPGPARNPPLGLRLPFIAALLHGGISGVPGAPFFF